MTPAADPRGDLATLARETRSLLERVRESRWPGIEDRGGPTAAPPAAGLRRASAPAVPKPAAAPAARSAATPRPAAAAAAGPPAGESPWATLEEIARAVASCTRCRLHATRTNTVPGEGSPTAALVFVGEGPGADEDRLGRPFVGAAGRLLDDMIAAMGLARGEVFIANVVKCRPPGNRDPEPEETAACLPYLHAQLALIRPRVVCALGKHAAHALLETKTPISRLRGRFVPWRGVSLMPTFHPSYLLRTPGDKKLAWKDLQEVIGALGLPLPDPAAARRKP